MPDVIRNGVILPALPQIMSPKQRAKTQKLANRYFKAREIIDYSQDLIEKKVIPIIAIGGVGYHCCCYFYNCSER